MFETFRSSHLLFRKRSIQADPGHGKSVEREAPKAKIFLDVEPLPKMDVLKTEPIEQPKPENWSNDIVELEGYFAGDYTTKPAGRAKAGK